jgi:hypothetical protein
MFQTVIKGNVYEEVSIIIGEVEAPHILYKDWPLW